MSSHVIIPATAPGNGPQFTKFPKEVLLEIFKHTIRLSPESKMGVMVDHKYFPFINGMGTLYRLRRVSKHFAQLAMVAFYEANWFKFRLHLTSSPLHFTASGNRLAPALPPPALRNCLRHMAIHISLEDFFNTPHPMDYIPTSPGDSNVSNRIVSVEQLFQYSPGARLLRDLTSDFCGLKKLYLIITPLFVHTGHIQETLAIMRSAKFSVRAHKVRVVVQDSDGEIKAWYTELKEAITIA